MADEKRPFTIAGPSSAAALAKSEHRPALVDRVYMPRASTTLKVLVYRLRKAMASGDRAEIKKAASAMTHDERDVALEQIAKSAGGANIVKNFWNRATRKYDIPETPERKREPERPKTAVPLAVAGDGTSKVVRVAVSDIVHFTTDGMLIHARVKSVGRLGVRAVDREGDEYQVLAKDLHAGIHVAAAIEAAQLRDRAARAAQRAWESVGMDPTMAQKRTALRAAGLSR